MSIHIVTYKQDTKTSKDLPRAVFVLGGPGAGKGTQCANLVRDYGVYVYGVGWVYGGERERERRVRV